MNKIVAKDKKRLQLLINQEMKKNGPNCDLNHIDVNNVTDMSYMFWNSQFNGDISKWDVSNVTDMSFMFWNSKFNGDISKWNVSNVTDMYSMFYKVGSSVTYLNGMLVMKLIWVICLTVCRIRNQDMIMKKYTQEEALKILAENFCTKIANRGEWICFSKIDDVEVKFRTNDEEWVTGRLLGDDAANEDNYELTSDRNIRGAERLARLLSHDYNSNVIVSDNDNVYILTEDEMLNMSNQDIQDLYEDIVK